MNHDLVKVLFRLERDADGYPPADSESIWARPLGGGEYALDNIPFFVKGVSCGDVVRVAVSDGERWVAEVVRYCGHGTVRVLAADAADVPALREELQALGCGSELSHISKLIAVDIPPDIPYDSVQPFLRAGMAQGRFDYEEAAIWAPPD